MRIRTLNIQMSDRVLLPILYSLLDKYQKGALKDPILRNDITQDRIYLSTKIYVVNFVKILRLIYQLLFIAYLYGQLVYIFSDTLYSYLHNTDVSKMSDTNSMKDFQIEVGENTYVDN
jgi:hypothetical protein